MKRTNHGECDTRLYRIWTGMKGRCHVKSDSGYKYYGEKGVSVCEEWRSNFLVFKGWSLQNGYSDDLTIDRIDNHGSYNKENCQWITQHEQVIKQDRFSHRDKEDRYILYTKKGKFVVLINKKRRTTKDHAHMTFDTIEQARVERNIIAFCVENNLEYKYPYFVSDISGSKKGDGVERKKQRDSKIHSMLSDGVSVREIAKKLKVGTVAIWKIKRKLDQEVDKYIYSQVEILSRMS